MPAKYPTIRFVVGSPHGARASTWRCWTPGNGKSDVYLAPRSIAGAFHLSLHESGAWHVGYTTQFKRKMIVEGRWQAKSRLIAEFPRPKEIGEGTVLAFRILVPASAVSIETSQELLPNDVVWLPAPPPNHAAEIAVVLTAPAVKTEGWPGSRSMSTSLIGQLLLDSGTRLWLVHRNAAIPVLGTMQGSFGTYVPEPEASQRLEKARALVLVDIDGEPAAFMECRIEDNRSGLKVPG